MTRNEYEKLPSEEMMQLMADFLLRKGERFSCEINNILQLDRFFTPTSTAKVVIRCWNIASNKVRNVTFRLSLVRT